MKKRFIILLLILIPGLFLRLYNISGSPPSLNWDEASLGYNAYSILMTGKDEYGTRLPLFLRSFDDYKSAIPSYIMMPFINIFGLNELGVRLPSVIFGSLTIVVVYFLARKLFRNETVALLSSYIYSIEPWSVHFSRVYQEATISNFFLFAGFLLFLEKAKRKYFLPLSFLCFVFSMYIYHSNKVAVPLFLIFLFILYFKKIFHFKRKYLLLSGVILLFSLSIFLYLILLGQIFPRVESTSILRSWKFSGILSIYDLLWNFGGRVLSYFSPPNLFLREPLEPTSQIGGLSLFYAFEYIPWLVGLCGLLASPKKYKELTGLILISIFPASLTWNWFQPNRVMSLFTIYSMLIGVGIYELMNCFSKIVTNFKKFARTLFLFGFLVYSLIMAFSLFEAVNIQLPVVNSGAWQPGFRETVSKVMKLSENFDQVVVETPHAQPYIFYLFYGKYSPDRYHQDILITNPGTPRKVYDFGKFHFRKIYWPKDKDLKRTLFVGNNDNLPDKDIDIKSILIIEKTYDVNGNESAKIVGNK